MVSATHQASKDNPLAPAPLKQSVRPPSATIPSVHPLTPDERKAVASGWNALPVQSVTCFLLGFLHNLDIPLSELQPYLQRTLSKIPSLQAIAPIGAPTRRLVLELGQGTSSLEQAIDQALVAYFSRRVLYEVERSMLIGLTLQLSSTASIQSTSDLLAAVESDDFEVSLIRYSAGDLAKAS